MKKYQILAAVAALLVLSACEKKNAQDGVKDALDSRPAEKVRDAAEDTKDAVKGAAKDAKDAVKDATK